MKIGVTQLGARAQWALRLEREHRGWWPFAYTLLEDLSHCYHPDDEPLVERLYRSMAGGNHVFKITKSQRFADLDAMLAKTLTSLANGHKLVVHDIGSSNGITTLDLFERLSQLPAIEVVGSDWFDRLTLVRAPGTRWTCVFDRGGRCLQIVGNKFVLSGYRHESYRYFVNRLLQRRAWSHVVPKARAALTAQPTGDGTQPGVREIRLLHPLVARRAEVDHRLRFIRHDVFNTLPCSVDVVRVMNLLTTRHFAEDRVIEGLQACLGGVRNEGLLVLGRSIDEEDGRLRATAYRKHADGTLGSVWSLHGGYEHDDLLSLAAQNVSRTVQGMTAASSERIA